MVEVSVIIVNYNTAEEAGHCIRSVLEHTKDIVFEIILLDNNSTDRSIEYIADTFPGIRYVRNTENEGFGRACNKAAGIARGRFLLLLNPDTILKNNALLLFQRFWNLYDADLSISCLGAQLSNGSGERVHSAGSFPLMQKVLKQKIKSLTGRLYQKQSLPEKQSPISGFKAVDYVTGANLFLSKTNFDEAGGFDPRFFMYFEETDLQYRLWQNGKQAYLVLGPEIEHMQYKSFKGDTRLQRVLYRDSMLRYFKKHHPGPRFFIFRLSWYLLDFRTLVQKMIIL